ncbi:hypothetical protein DFP73DRAFT_524410 [Morchella snyderi]|nr:hypothetical protein DFP73DRAFT_524410 [Morchella snyderi]
MTNYMRSAVSYIGAQFDSKVADQDARERFYRNAVVFSRHQPFLASFIAIQLLFGILPVLGLLGFALGVIGVAVGFMAFWVGVGLCIMLSALAFTATIATCIWASLITTLLFFRWGISTFLSTPASTSPNTPQKKQDETSHKRVEAEQNGIHDHKENRSPSEVPIKTEEPEDEGNQKVYGGLADTSSEEDGDSMTPLASYDENELIRENLKPSYTPVVMSDAEKMKRDIERSLK